MEMSQKSHKIKKSTSMTNAELPLSLIESDILPRLTAKTVGRCKCVCKQWESFLSTPSFTRSHLQYQVTMSENYKLLLLEGATFRTLDQGGSSTVVPNPDPSAEFIVGSMDGLICLASKEHAKLAFWNPLTGAYKKLSTRPCSFCTITPHDVIGFYHDSYSNDYKLLYLVWGGCLGAYIYSNRLDSWKGIEYPFTSIDFRRCSQASLCGDCLYFTVTYDIHQTVSWVVICFDIKSESFRKIMFPPFLGDVRYDDYSASLVVLNGCLHLCVCYYTRDFQSKRSDLWRMHGDGWVHVATFNNPSLTSNGDFTRQHICSLTTAGDSQVVLDQVNICLKEINTEDFTKQFQYYCSPSWECRSSRIIYVETLVSPNT